MPATTEIGRCPVREACRLLACGLTTYERKWQHVFTDARNGNRRVVNRDEIAEALKHARYEESVIAVESLRAKKGRLKP